MATYAELKAKAEKFAAEAEEARKKEVVTVIAEMKAKMEEYSITPEDLGIRTAGYAPARKSSTPSKPAGTPAEAKYQSPTGETWSGGRGRKPKWVTELVAAGTDIEKYRIGPQA